MTQGQGLHGKCPTIVYFSSCAIIARGNLGESARAQTCLSIYRISLIFGNSYRANLNRDENALLIFP